MAAISNRYEFVYLFDVENGNPNGDPDAGNMPRIDTETGYGLVTDVCLKRKVRNYVDLARDTGAVPAQGYNVYVREKAVLNEQHELAYKALDLKPEAKKLPKKEQEAHALTRWMCDNFFDVRTFGAVMTTEVNCGQVRGPVQLAFARSVEPIIPQEVSITRMAVTNAKDLEKERTMGRKHIVPYALYRAEGFVSAPLAMGERGTGFSEDDLKLLWEALANMFDHDRSAARGKMAARGLVVFKHDAALGNAQAQALFDLVTVSRADGSQGPARAFADYRVAVDESGVPQGVSCEVKF
ncbi:type I-C CRISPR-associated protein Cas7/Csd2 [Desulfocurvus vexinensis]|uniref:type I-C CRISPR-associated protein Cas7/Csd2 n=1 Tax=Desulfocurvus vexinensis TaxID=399548 RepID=UPI000491AAF8|nr:type I-C CRISPR-associated protein Cas7/Csd2 [Desulfocurvus vexinensis]